MADNTTALAMLKTDLGFYAPDGNTERFMLNLIDSARLQVAGKGITLDDTKADDLNLLVMYAAWLYRRRDGSGAMPDMLGYALRNRIVTEATAEATAT